MYIKKGRCPGTSLGVSGRRMMLPLERVAEDTANAIRDCRGPLQGPRNDNIVP